MKKDVQHYLRTFLREPVSIASLAFVRIFFGLAMLVETGRFFAKGWINTYYIKPEFYFPYQGFEWVKSMDDSRMYGVFAAIGLAAFMIMIGLLTRLAALTFFFLFTYIFLIDQTNYLNHFYLISLLGLLFVFLPSNADYSVDARLFPHLRRQKIAIGWVWLLRWQIFVPYFYGGIAKMGGDWLLRAEPMRTWLAGNSDLPVVGGWFLHPAAPYFFAWSGMLFDLFVAFCLLWRPTRRWAFVAALFFHLTNATIFEIGIFPWLMMAATTIFFNPDWCEGLLKPFKSRAVPAQTAPNSGSYAVWLTRPAYTALGLYIFWQTLMPFRHFFIPGDVHWTGEGHYFAWHMRLLKKTGETSFRVFDKTTGKKIPVKPKELLTSRQYRVMRANPQMIFQFSHYLAEYCRQQGYDDVDVRAKTLVRLNARPPQLLIDSTVNLAAIPRYETPAPWILPLRRQ